MCVCVCVYVGVRALFYVYLTSLDIQKTNHTAKPHPIYSFKAADQTKEELRKVKEREERAADLGVDVEGVDVRAIHVVPEGQTLGLTVGHWLAGQVSLVVGVARVGRLDEHVVSSTLGLKNPRWSRHVNV